MGRRINIYFNISSPTPGTFIIALHFKGREKPILEMDLKIDDLLEKVRRWRRTFPSVVFSNEKADESRSKKITRRCWIWSMFS